MMLQLLLVAKGWTISNTTLSRKPLLIAIWIIYTIIYIILFIFNLVSIIYPSIPTPHFPELTSGVVRFELAMK